MKPFLNELPLLKNLKRTRKEKKTGYESAAETTHFTHTDKAPTIPPPSHIKTTFFSQSLQLQIQVFILTTDLGKV